MFKQIETYVLFICVLGIVITVMGLHGAFGPIYEKGPANLPVITVVERDENGNIKETRRPYRILPPQP